MNDRRSILAYAAQWAQQQRGTHYSGSLPPVPHPELTEFVADLARAFALLGTERADKEDFRYERASFLSRRLPIETIHALRDCYAVGSSFRDIA